MSSVNYLNLSRKWRSKQFDQLVGQGLVVKLLKNSLYKKLFFPVYLFSGPRGSGKTSTARIFASAINCDLLDSFQDNPQKVNLPCLLCKSCSEMQSQSHPDFIEMDAASNTGVDNIRVLLENVAFVPVLGRKKVYLIDEAHMLSKSAFNALLKVFEEPPASVIFMLATTDPGKILETVRSRCFQLFFKSINSKDIFTHLQLICREENISIEDDALEVISLQADGSLRDALNLLEQAKLLGSKITKKLILELLGSLDFSVIDLLVSMIVKGDVAGLLEIYSQNNIEKYNSYDVFKKIIEAFNNLLLKSYKTSENLNQQYLLNAIEFCYNQEHLFYKTASPGILLQSILIKLCHFRDGTNLIHNFNKIDIDSSINKNNKFDILAIKNSKSEIVNKPVDKFNGTKDVTKESQSVPIVPNDKISKMLIKLEEIKEPLLLSLFKQSSINFSNNKLDIEFTEEAEMFSDIIDSKKTSWHSVIRYFYGDGIEINYKFFKRSGSDTLINVNRGNSVSQNIVNVGKKNIENNNYSDIDKWPLANNLVKIFPGNIENN